MDFGWYVLSALTLNRGRGKKPFEKNELQVVDLGI